MPSSSKLSVYKDSVLQKLNSWPDDKLINWTELARQCEIEGRNKGQIAKTIAQQSGIDMSRFSGKQKHSTKRPCRAKLPGNEISMPCMPTTSSIRESIAELFDSGKLRLGEPCAPFSLLKCIVKDGQINKQTTVVHGRKVPLLELQEKLLLKHEPYMRLLADSQIDQMTSEAIKSILKNTPVSDVNILELRDTFKAFQKARSLVLWHDHSTILGKGYILMTVHVLYDSVVFLSQAEYESKTGTQISRSIQAIVEEPEIYMLCLSGSSPSDQAATIADLLDCLPDLSRPVKSTSGISINDTLHFFIGDHSAQAYERGSQLGGNYKCGSCGCLSNRMDDLADALRCSWLTFKP